MSEHSSPLHERLRCRVHGRVQGVGFRWFVCQQARGLGLAGTVENLPDGTVVLEAAGAPTALAKLRVLVQDGPPGARVDRIEELTPSGLALPSRFTMIR